MKKKYETPIFDKVQIILSNVIMGSGPEEFKSYVDGPGDWGDDPIIDPDDSIIW